MSATSVVWLRNDLRLSDHPALFAAAEHGEVVVVFVHNPKEGGAWKAGAASLVWKHHSLAALARALAKRKVPLVLRRGDTGAELVKVAREVGADRIFANRRWEPWAREQEAQVEEALEEAGFATSYFHGVTLRAPDEVRTGSGGPFRVFTPFWRALSSLGDPDAPLPEPERIASPSKRVGSLALEELGLLPEHPWASGTIETWSPGEDGAWQRMQRFIEGPLTEYSSARDRMDQEGISRLSPHLHHGELSARQLWYQVRQRQLRDDLPDKAVEPYLRQLGWREFGHALLWHFPHTSDQPFNERFSDFPWAEDRAALRSWQRGLTGYPIVDAGMRELWQTGWMHNRVRMIVASLLTKHLLITWREGAAWFWDTLFDADLANNSMGWQWTAGCGADAAPYFRVFNPILQGERFDPDGAYVRRYVPELAGLPNSLIHKPWTAPPLGLREAGVELGETYPLPIVEHKYGRERALAAYAELRAAR